VGIDLPKPIKAMGQNFLINRWICQAIVAASGFGPKDVVLELGPGLGALTFELAKQVKHVTAVELDSRMLQYLALKAQAEQLTNISLVKANMLHLDFKHLSQKDMGQPLKIIGNLPYNISSPMLFHLVEARNYIEQAVLMLQKELADRMTAPPGCKAYGILSVVFQYAARIEHLLDVPPSMFRPAPKVMSSVIRIGFRPPSLVVRDFSLFLRMVKAVFQQRRKTIANSLKAFMGSDELLKPIDVLALLDTYDIDFQTRPEIISVEGFVRLANTLADIKDGVHADHYDYLKKD